MFVLLIFCYCHPFCCSNTVLCFERLKMHVGSEWTQTTVRYWNKRRKNAYYIELVWRRGATIRRAKRQLCGMYSKQWYSTKVTNVNRIKQQHITRRNEQQQQQQQQVKKRMWKMLMRPVAGNARNRAREYNTERFFGKYIREGRRNEKKPKENVNDDDVDGVDSLHILIISWTKTIFHLDPI